MCLNFQDFCFDSNVLKDISIVSLCALCLTLLWIKGFFVKWKWIKCQKLQQTLNHSCLFPEPFSWVPHIWQLKWDAWDKHQQFTVIPHVCDVEQWQNMFPICLCLAFFGFSWQVNQTPHFRVSQPQLTIRTCHKYGSALLNCTGVHHCVLCPCSNVHQKRH